jgi:alpha-1,2-mannosyltransferase
VLAWHVPADRRRDLPKVAAGAAVALLAIDGPFFMAAPSQMWHMVVTEQLGRHRIGISSVTRLSQLTGVQGVVSRLGHPAAVAVSVLLVVVVFCIVALAWRMRAARVVVVLGVVQFALLMTTPSWFSFYSDYLAPTAALVLAAAVSQTALPTTARPGATLRTRMISWVSLLAAAAGTCAYLSGPHQSVSTFPSTRLASAVRHTRCVMSDSPMGLILLDTLSKGLGDGCPNWIDVTGRTYGVDAGTLPGGKFLSRVDNPTWQHDLLNYLRSGDAVMLIRTAGTGVSHQTQTALRRGGILATADGHTIDHTPH